MATKVITGEVRFSFVQVFEPKAIKQGDKEKYSVSLLIPKTDTKTINEIKAAIAEATELGKAKVFEGKIPVNLKTPLRDGDEEKPDEPAYVGHYFVNANSDNRPGIVDETVKPIMSRDEFYSGCYGRASINFYAFNVQSKGIACGLNNVQKLRDGEKLAGAASAEEDFGASDLM